MIRKYDVPVVALLAGAALLAVAAVAADVAPVNAPTLALSIKPVEKAPGPDGFIQRWLLLEPIPVQGLQLTQNAIQAAAKKEYFPNQFTVIPKTGDKVTVNGAELTWRALDTNRYNFNLYHFARGYDKSPSNVLFWAVTLIDCPQEIPNVRLAIGSNAASVWWVNGEEVTGIYGDIQTVIDSGISKRLTLKKGQNVVRGMIANAGVGATDFCARFLDANNKPLLKGFTVSAGDVPVTAPKGVMKPAPKAETKAAPKGEAPAATKAAPKGEPAPTKAAPKGEPASTKK